MATTTLPLIPWLVFAVFEPISLFAGFVGATGFPDWFLVEQIQQIQQIQTQQIQIQPQQEAANTANSRLVAMQLGNMYLLMALVGIAVLGATTEQAVARSYLVALWVADIGHLGLTAHGMGLARLTDVAGWNSMAWGNIGATAFLFVMRTVYLAGMFDKRTQSTNRTNAKGARID